MDCSSRAISADSSVGQCLDDVPMQGDSCEEEFACQKMSLYKDIAVFLVQGGIGVE